MYLIDAFSVWFALVGPVGLYLGLRPAPVPDWLRKHSMLGYPDTLERTVMVIGGSLFVTFAAIHFAGRIMGNSGMTPDGWSPGP
jgi:hypothetical protein